MDAALRSDGEPVAAVALCAMPVAGDGRGDGFGGVGAADDADAVGCEHYRSTLDFVDRLTVTGRCCC